MMLLLNYFVASVFLLDVYCSNPQTYRRVYERRSKNDAFKQIVNTIKMLIDERQDGRKFDSAEYKRNYLLDTLKMDLPKRDYNRLLRHQIAETTMGPIYQNREKLASLVEGELKYALAKKQSALFDRPFVQKKGKQDFLVIHPGDLDPFVTVIPNDIFYNHEKSCVNWLEDCNIQGIRSRLLQKIG